MGSPVWSRDGMIAVANAHKEKVKLTFTHGAQLADPDKLFNAGLDGNAWRAIDFFEGDKIDAPALKNLVRAAIDTIRPDRRRSRLRRRKRRLRQPKLAGAKSCEAIRRTSKSLRQFTRPAKSGGRRRRTIVNPPCSAAG